MKKLPTLRPSSPALLLAGALLFLSAIAAAQTPQNIPTESTPIDLNSWTDILLYIGGPILLVVLYLVMRRRGHPED